MTGFASCPRVAEIWRYPVKSMLGEPLDSVELTSRGVAGDRRYAVRDASGKLGSGKTTRRFRHLRGLFDYSARTDGDGTLVRLPEGEEVPIGSAVLDATLSTRYGEELRVAEEEDVPHLDAGAVHVVTTASLRWLEEQLGEEASARRFRPNLVVEAAGAERVEDGWLGATLRVGSCVLRVRQPTERCVMVTFAQPGLREAPAVLETLARRCEARLGVYAEVVAPGRLARSDHVQVER